MRNEILRFAATAAIIASGTLSTSCNQETQQPTIDSRPGISSPSVPDLQKQSWNKLPAKDRISRLLQKDYPDFSGFNRQKEVATATSQNYCEQTRCGLSPEQIARDIYYVDSNLFIQALMPEMPNKTLTPKEIDKEKATRLAITNSNGQIYINQELMDEVINDMTDNDPDTIKQLGSKDLRTAYEISILAHEITHKNKLTKKIPDNFDGFSLGLPGEPERIIFNILNGFQIEGKNPSGDAKFIVGGDEAITDRAARIIVEKKMGLPYLSIPEYIRGSILVRRLNSIADVSDDDFLSHVRGELSQSQLLEKWGAHRIGAFNTGSDLKAGILTLAEIGLAVQGIIGFQEVEQGINSDFRS